MNLLNTFKNLIRVSKIFFASKIGKTVKSACNKAVQQIAKENNIPLGRILANILINKWPTRHCKQTLGSIVHLGLVQYLPGFERLQHKCRKAGLIQPFPEVGRT